MKFTLHLCFFFLSENISRQPKKGFYDWNEKEVLIISEHVKHAPCCSLATNIFVSTQAHAFGGGYGRDSGV